MSGTKAILVSCIAVFVLFGYVKEIVAPEPKKGLDSIEIETDEGRRELGLDLEQLETRLGEVRSVDELAEVLDENRLNLNVEIFKRLVEYRMRWVNRLEGVLRLACLAFLLLLLAPFSRYRSHPLRETLPLFLVATCVMVMLTSALITFVIAIEEVQIALATLGAPNVVITDALVHYVLFFQDQDLAQVLQLLQQGLSSADSNPVQALGLLYHLMDAVAQARESSVLGASWTVLGWLAWLVHLYGPAIAAATALLAWAVLSPIIREQIRYPFQIMDGEREPGLWRYLKSQLAIWWRELRAVMWMMLYIVLLVLIAVVLVRVLAFPVVVAAIKTLLATLQQVESGGGLSDFGLVLSLTSLVLFLVVSSLLIIGAMGLAAAPVGWISIVTKFRSTSFC